MIKIKMDFDADGFRRKIMDAAEKQVQQKLFARGIQGVTVKAMGMNGDEVKFEFSGPAENVKRAKEAFGVTS